MGSKLEPGVKEIYHRLQGGTIGFKLEPHSRLQAGECVNARKQVDVRRMEGRSLHVLNKANTTERLEAGPQYMTRFDVFRLSWKLKLRWAIPLIVRSGYEIALDTSTKFNSSLNSKGSKSYFV